MRFVRLPALCRGGGRGGRLGRPRPLPPPEPDRQRMDFQRSRDVVELNQLLKLAGMADSGGAGKALVASGAVRVDGTVELRKTCKIRARQRVEVGQLLIEVAAG